MQRIRSSCALKGRNCSFFLFYFRKLTMMMMMMRVSRRNHWRRSGSGSTTSRTQLKWMTTRYLHFRSSAWKKKMQLLLCTVMYIGPVLAESIFAIPLGFLGDWTPQLDQFDRQSTMFQGQLFWAFLAQISVHNEQWNRLLCPQRTLVKLFTKKALNNQTFARR